MFPVIFCFVALLSLCAGYGIYTPLDVIGAPFTKESSEASAFTYRIRDFRVKLNIELMGTEESRVKLRDPVLGVYGTSGMHALDATDLEARVFNIPLAVMSIDMICNIGRAPVGFADADRSLVPAMTMANIADIFHGVITEWEQLNPLQTALGRVPLDPGSITLLLPSNSSAVVRRFTERMQAEQATFGYSWNITPSDMPVWPAGLNIVYYPGGDEGEIEMAEIVRNDSGPLYLSIATAHTRLQREVPYADVVLQYADPLLQGFMQGATGSFTFPVQSWLTFVQTSATRIYGSEIYNLGELAVIPGLTQTSFYQRIVGAAVMGLNTIRPVDVAALTSFYPIFAPISLYLREYNTTDLENTDIRCSQQQLLVLFGAFASVNPSTGFDATELPGLVSLGQAGADRRAKIVRALTQRKCGENEITDDAMVIGGNMALMSFVANIEFLSVRQQIVDVYQCADDLCVDWFAKPEGFGAGTGVLARGQPWSERDVQRYLDVKPFLNSTLADHPVVSLPLAAEAVVVMFHFAGALPASSRTQLRLSLKTLSDIILYGNVTNGFLATEQTDPVLDAYFSDPLINATPVIFVDLIGDYDYKAVVVAAMRRAGVDSAWSSPGYEADIPSSFNYSRIAGDVFYLGLPASFLLEGALKGLPISGLALHWMGVASTYADLFTIAQLPDADGVYRRADSKDDMRAAIEAAALRTTRMHPDVTEFETDLTFTSGGYPLLAFNWFMVPRVAFPGAENDVRLASDLATGVFTDSAFRLALDSSDMVVLSDPYQSYSLRNMLSLISEDGEQLAAIAPCIEPKTGNICSYNGRCVDNQCFCDRGHVGDTCDAKSCVDPDGGNDDQVCNGHGSCNYDKNTCDCDKFYDGDYCEDQVPDILPALLGGILGPVGAILCCLCVCVLCLCCIVLFAVLALLVLVVLAVVIAIALVVVIMAASTSVVTLRSRHNKRTATLEREHRERQLTLEQLLEKYEADDGLGYREINYEDLELLESIGQGAFGTVYFGTWLGAEVAVKVLHTATQLTDNVLDDFRREAAMMTNLGNHPNLVSFIGAVTKGEHFCIVTEFCAHGSLIDLLEAEKLTEAEIVTMALNITRGVYYLHKSGVVHRDIAARNCLVDKDFNVKVSDFGACRLTDDENPLGFTETASRLGEREAEVESMGSVSKGTQVKGSQKMKFIPSMSVEGKENVGPVRWMAPESLCNRQYTEMSDVYMFGITLWEMWHRQRPYEGMPIYDVMMGVSTGKLRPAIDDDCPPYLAGLMKKCWKKKPEERLSMEKILHSLEARLQHLSEGSGQGAFTHRSNSVQGDSDSDMSSSRPPSSAGVFAGRQAPANSKAMEARMRASSVGLSRRNLQLDATENDYVVPHAIPSVGESNVKMTPRGSSKTPISSSSLKTAASDYVIPSAVPSLSTGIPIEENTGKKKKEKKKKLGKKAAKTTIESPRPMVEMLQEVEYVDED